MPAIAASPESSSAEKVHDRRYEASQALMVLGLGGLVLSGFLASRGREPFATWFYCFAWWSYILFVDGWVYRHRKESLILSFPGRFAFLSAWSVVLWLSFELINFRLQNWSYSGVPADQTARWIGYLVAYATVVPGILETADLIESAGFVKDVKTRALGFKRRVGPYFFAAGVVMVALPAFFPKYFFPLIWGSLFFLLEPVNERLGINSILSDWRLGQLKRFLTLLLAGLFCGILWEWWNSIARARWTYSIPFVGGWKIFDMPVLGFFGFPPFAVEVFSASALAAHFWDKSSKPVRAIFIILGLTFALGMCWALDRWTVRAFQ
jgi:hypothetical protein